MQHNYLVEALAKARTRQSWNDRLEHWEKPASDSEEAIIDRAARSIRSLMAENKWFTDEGVQICAQGSYYNNTNVRQESDIDLRAVHPMIEVVYSQNVVRSAADSVLRYSSTGRTFGQVLTSMRNEMIVEFARSFGALNVEADGTKAIRVKAVPGSRAPVDVVPCFKLHYVEWAPHLERYLTSEGIMILSRYGDVTYNFPGLHNSNGIQKRARTQHRFKRNGRMLKRIRDELVDNGTCKAKDIPSFLVECLVYRVEDAFFLVESDDRYDRLLRIVQRIYEQVNDPNWTSTAQEINDIKFLFGAHQSWTLDAAKAFAAAAWTRLQT